MTGREAQHPMPLPLTSAACRSSKVPSNGRWRNDAPGARCGRAVDGKPFRKADAMKLVDKWVVAEPPGTLWLVLPEGATNI